MRTTQADRRSPDNSGSIVRQGIGIATAAGLAALAVIASAGNHNSEKYDVDTEAALQHAIRPTMVRMAEEVTRAAVIAPGSYDERYRKGGEVTTIVVSEKAGGEFGHVEVVTGIKPDTKQADPRKVRSVRIAGSTSLIALTAPGEGVDNLPFPYDDAGWVAAEVRYAGLDSQIVERYLNSADAQHLVTVPVKPSNSVAIAREVVTDAIEASNDVLAAAR